jgi:hypothetical protein
MAPPVVAKRTSRYRGPVAPGDGTGVKFTLVRACLVEFPVGNPIQQGGRISLGYHACHSTGVLCHVKAGRSMILRVWKNCQESRFDPGFTGFTREVIK